MAFYYECSVLNASNSFPCSLIRLPRFNERIAVKVVRRLRQSCTLGGSS